MYKTSIKKEEPRKLSWSDFDMMEMDREIESFREEIDGKKKHTRRTDTKWLESKKAIRIGEHLGKEQIFVSEMVYPLMSEKLSFYCDWKRRKGFGEKAKLEALDKIVQEMTL